MRSPSAPCCEQRSRRGSARARRMHWVDEADHAFHVPARSGRKDAQVRGALLAALAAWMEALS